MLLQVPFLLSLVVLADILINQGLSQARDRKSNKLEGTTGQSKKDSRQTREYVLNANTQGEVSLTTEESLKVVASFANSCSNFDVLAFIREGNREDSVRQLSSEKLQKQPCRVKTLLPSGLPPGAYELLVGIGNTSKLQEVEALRLSVKVGGSSKLSNNKGQTVTGICRIENETISNGRTEKLVVCREFQGSVEVVDKQMDECGRLSPGPLPPSDCEQACKPSNSIAGDNYVKVCSCADTLERHLKAATKRPGSCETPSGTQICAIRSSGLVEKYHYYTQTKHSEKNCAAVGGQWSVIP